MERWIDFEYREFHDVPRTIVARLDSSVSFLLVSRFDERLDEYEPSYRCFLLPNDVDLTGSWVDLESHAVRVVGEVEVSRVRFDETRRTRLDVHSLGLSDLTHDDAVALSLSVTGSQVDPLDERSVWTLQSRWRASFGIGGGPPGNVDWHVFSYRRREHRSGAKAERAYSEAQKDQVVVLFVGPRNDVHGYRVSGALPPPSELRNLASRMGGDLYVTSYDFSWTMVWPHEDDLGPYFAQAAEG